MKKSVASLFSLFLLSCVSSEEPIHDTDGELLRNGGTYTIISSSGGEEVGGISLAATGNDTCPLTVVQNSIRRGLSVRISSIILTGFLYEGFPLSFTFTGSMPSCVPLPNYWTVVEESAVKVHESQQNGFFTIKAVGKATYKIVFKKKDIGVRVGDDGLRSLVVTEDKPLKVVFKKVNNLSYASASA